MGAGGPEATAGPAGRSWPAGVLKRAASGTRASASSYSLPSFLSSKAPFHNKRFSNGPGLGVVFRTLWPAARVGL